MARISPALAEALPSLLAESPDPDSAIILFDRLLSEASAETVQLLNSHNFLAHYALVIFAHSRYLGETLIQNVDLFQSFLRERNLDHSFSHEHFQESLSRFRARSLETDISLLLARFKRREYVRIMLRDVLKISPLAETTSEISTLADVLIAEALRVAESSSQRLYGTAQHLGREGRLADARCSILSLGKLGGNELNYSSDVDLIYIFAGGKEPAEAVITNREYFIRLSEQITDILSRMTREGPVFRIDLRLRPQGNEGELAISLETALRYYASSAQDWERQALIKIRHCAGDISLSREFIRRLQPLIYREHSKKPEAGSKKSNDPKTLSAGPSNHSSDHEGFNFAAIKTALVAREKIDKRRHRTPRDLAAGIDVKLDHGGIRDIEFLVQCLQRVYGGAEPWLRSGGTLFSLQKLHDKAHLSGKEFHDLTSAYEFLRHVEHRLQLRQGQQTHQLPAAQPELAVLQKSMEGYAPQEYDIDDLVSTVRRRMSAVAEIYQRIIYHQSRSQLDSVDIGFRLKAGLQTDGSQQSTEQILERLAQDAGGLHEILTSKRFSPNVQRNIFRFLTSVLTSSQRYAELIRNPQIVIRALALFECSNYLAEVLIRHPEEIIALVDISEAAARAASGYLFPSELSRGRASSDPVFEYVATSPVSAAEKLSLLRKHFRHCIFAAGVRDLASLRGVYESLDSVTAAAEDAITAALAIAGNPPGLAILAVGRLGSRELDLFSDADLLFVGEAEPDRERLTRCAQQIMQALSAYTQDGTVLPIDTRLRPRGSAGELLVTPAQLATYFEQEAQPWEALTYTKLRLVAGSRTVGEQVTRLADKLYARYASDSNFPHAVRTMREKLAATNNSELSFKTSPGGTYDIDFLTGYLLIKNRVSNKQGNLRDRIWKCAAASLLDKSDAAHLDHAAELLRTTEHVGRLAQGKVGKWMPVTEHARHATETITSQILNQKFPTGLEAELQRTFIEVRSIYERALV